MPLKFRTFSVHEWNEARINNQALLVRTGTDVSDLQTGVSFFVFDLIGTGAVIKDKDGNTIIAAPGIFNTPIRIEDGITLGATGAASCHYFTLRNDI